jgi:uncharacterized protein (TIGR03067 family)
VKGSLDGGVVLIEAGSRMTISGRTLAHLTGGRATACWTITLDATKQPKHCDLTDSDGGKGVLAIDHIDGDTLTCAWRNGDNARGRPLDFRGGPGLGVAVYRRVKR